MAGITTRIVEADEPATLAREQLTDGVVSSHLHLETLPDDVAQQRVSAAASSDPLWRPRVVGGVRPWVER